MHGFKSFAEPVTIEFDRGITCVVGPNGSGKSNISDAIRWVLGEQSPKMLRGAKMDEVIFAGTAGRKSRGMAEVTLTIDNTDGSLDIDYQEVAITRRMYRTGESEYYINRNQCRLRDIRELIMDTGIGVDGYSIIGQGKISDIVSNKTDGRREIFEEAAGIVAYRNKKAESERKLESTTANMDRVLDIINEINRKLPSLKDDSAKAEEYIKLRDRYKELEINIVLKNIEKLQLNEEFMKDEILEVNMDLDNLKEERVEAEAKLAEFNRKNENLEKIAAETQQKLLDTIDELNSLTNKWELDNERASSIDNTIATLEEEIKLARSKVERELENRKELECAKREADKNLTILRTALNEKSAGYTEKSEELAALMTEIDNYKNMVFEASSKASNARAEIASLELLRENLDRRQQDIVNRKESGADNNRETIDSLNELKKERDHTSESIDESKEEQASILKDIILKKAEKSKLTSESEMLAIESGKLTSRAATLRELEENYDGYNYAVKYIMRAGLDGIHGVIADLIKVPEEYATAIETALGGALQNIVCDNDRSAKIAINKLKANKAGRITFLPVSSVHGNFRRDSNAQLAKGFVGFGPECVENNSEYDDIIANLLGRVIVVDNMDNAVTISKHISGYRLVTLEGEVISGNGAITGGKYKHKTANILDRKAEIENLEKRLKSNQKRKSEIDEALDDLSNQIEALDGKSSELDNIIREQTYQLLEKNNDIKNAETTLKDIKSQSMRIEQELSEIEEEKKNSKSMINEKENLAKTAEETRIKAEEQGELKSAEYEKLKSQFDSISEDITSARIDVNTCENQMNHVAEMMAKTEGTIKETEDEIKQKTDKINQLKIEKSNLSHGSVDSDDVIATKEEEKTHLQEYLNEVNEEKSEIAKNITSISDAKKQSDEKLNELQDKKYQLDIKKTKSETQLENYKNKLWDDFEVSYAQALDFRSDDFALSTAVKENRQIKSRIKELGEVNIGAIEEYKEEKKRYDFLTEQRDDIQLAMDEINSIIDEMDKKIKQRFKESFDQIVVNFEAKFQELFGGGHAELRLSDESNPLESDIDIIAQPPGKKLQNINLLSGGEKTLTAIALMFAVLGAKPTPFCILDEVEAALDDANIERFINCLRTLEGIQFTLVTHQKSTMEHADVLYGVTMPEKGVSKVLSLAMGDDFEI